MHRNAQSLPESRFPAAPSACEWLNDAKESAGRMANNVDTALFSFPTMSTTAHLGQWAGGLFSASSSSQNVPRKGAGGGSCWVLPSTAVAVFGPGGGAPVPAPPASAASASSSASLGAADNVCRLSWAALCLRPWILLPEVESTPLKLPVPPPSMLIPLLRSLPMTCDREWWCAANNGSDQESVEEKGRKGLPRTILKPVKLCRGGMHESRISTSQART